MKFDSKLEFLDFDQALVAGEQTTQTFEEVTSAEDDNLVQTIIPSESGRNGVLDAGISEQTATDKKVLDTDLASEDKSQAPKVVDGALRLQLFEKGKPGSQLFF